MMKRFAFLLAVSAIGAAPGVAQQSPMPPVVPVAPAMAIAPPPPVVSIARSDARPASFAVELWGGNERLWAGSLRLAGHGSAWFNSTLNQAPEACPADKSELGRYAPNSTTSVRVGVSRRSYQAAENAFSVSASWSRPGVPCVEDGSTTVTFDRPFDMKVGGKAEFKGDGSLMVRITRTK